MSARWLLASCVMLGAVTGTTDPRAGSRREASSRSAGAQAGAHGDPVNHDVGDPTDGRLRAGPRSPTRAPTGPWFVPHSACSDLEACADSVDRFCKRKGSSGETVEISNYACYGQCASGRRVRVFCA